MGGKVAYAPMLETIGAVFGPMGAPRGPVETRLAAINKGDLFWAEQEYARLRDFYRAVPPDGDRGLA